MDSTYEADWIELNQEEYKKTVKDMKIKRHKWEKEINHPYCHKYICKDCGCIKDTSSMSTIYWMNDEKHFNAPNCNPILVVTLK